MVETKPTGNSSWKRKSTSRAVTSAGLVRDRGDRIPLRCTTWLRSSVGGGFLRDAFAAVSRRATGELRTVGVMLFGLRVRGLRVRVFVAVAAVFFVCLAVFVLVVMIFLLNPSV